MKAAGRCHHVFIVPSSFASSTGCIDGTQSVLSWACSCAGSGEDILSQCGRDRNGWISDCTDCVWTQSASDNGGVCWNANHGVCQAIHCKSATNTSIFCTYFSVERWLADLCLKQKATIVTCLKPFALLDDAAGLQIGPAFSQHFQSVL